jgi:hypothetical protein
MKRVHIPAGESKRVLRVALEMVCSRDEGVNIKTRPARVSV